MPKIFNSDLVNFGLLAETTEGTFETSAPFPKMLTTGISPDKTGNILTDPTISGAGETVGADTNYRGGTLRTPAVLRHSDCLPLVLPFVRDVAVAAVTIVGSSNINVLTGGTHLDGSTGPQITAPTGTFNNLITYGGVTASTHPNGGAERLLMYLSGSAQGANNNWPRRIKAVHDDTSTAMIDILPGYVGGGAGTYGEPMVGTTLESITIKVGSTVRNRVIGAGVKAYSGLWHYSDTSTNAGYESMFGLVGNDLTMAWSGKEGATIDGQWLAHGGGEVVAADPSGQGFVDNNTYSQMMNAGAHLTTCAVVTASEPIVLSSFAMTGFSATLAGNCTAATDESGTTLTDGIDRGGHSLTGSINYKLKDDVRIEKLSQLGSASNNEKAGIDVIYTDAAGNRVVWGFLNNEFGQTGGQPGALGSGAVAGAPLQFTGSQATRYSRLFAWQEFAA